MTLIVVDSSAIVAVFQGELLARRLRRTMDDADALAISAATYVETGTVLAARQPTDPRRALQRLATFVAGMDMEIAPLDAAQALVAVEARVRFGKGLGGPGKLNLGDTYAYALAKVRGAPLLYVGDDFARTDIASALD